MELNSETLDSYSQAIGLDQGNIDTTSLGSIIGSILPYALTGAGIVLFVMLVIGGFNMLTGAANQESQEIGKKQITGALTGFAVIFLAYWIAQVLQIIFKVQIVG